MVCAVATQKSITTSGEIGQFSVKRECQPGCWQCGDEAEKMPA